MSDGDSTLTPSTTESIASEVYESFESAETPTETPASTQTPKVTARMQPRVKNWARAKVTTLPTASA